MLRRIFLAMVSAAADDEDKFFVRDTFGDLEGFETDSPERVPDGAAGGLCGAARGLNVNFCVSFVIRDEVEQTHMMGLKRRHCVRVVEIVFHKEFGKDIGGVHSTFAVIDGLPRLLRRQFPKLPDQIQVRSNRRFIPLPNRGD